MLFMKCRSSCAVSDQKSNVPVCCPEP